jgi:hypothetical protein
MRIQLRRTKGWRRPADSLKVDRTTIFGNPFTLDKYEPAKAVEMHRAWLTGAMSDGDIEKAYPPVVARHLIAKRAAVLAALPTLRGKSLACWCSLPADGQPDLCHAALLLTLANPNGGA